MYSPRSEWHLWLELEFTEEERSGLLFPPEAWRTIREEGCKQVPDALMSGFQREVTQTVESLQLGTPTRVHEFDTADHFYIDLALPKLRIAIEADGPFHFLATDVAAQRGRRGCDPTERTYDFVYDGHTRLKHRHLRALGWQIVSVPMFEWKAQERAGGQRQQTQYMQRLLEGPLADAHRRGVMDEPIAGAIDELATAGDRKRARTGDTPSGPSREVEYGREPRYDYRGSSRGGYDDTQYSRNEQRQYDRRDDGYGRGDGYGHGEAHRRDDRYPRDLQRQYERRDDGYGRGDGYDRQGDYRRDDSYHRPPPRPAYDDRRDNYRRDDYSRRSPPRFRSPPRYDDRRYENPRYDERHPSPPRGYDERDQSEPAARGYVERAQPEAAAARGYDEWPEQPATASSGGRILVTDWPTTGPNAARMRTIGAKPGNVRNDVLVEKRRVGVLIGAGGSTFKELAQKTGATICILDKEGPPPGFAEEQRLVAILGSEAQVALGSREVERLVGRAAERASKPPPQEPQELWKPPPQEPPPKSPQEPPQPSPEQPATASSGGRILFADWPTSGPKAARMRTLGAKPGNVRNDVLVEKRRVGVLIGAGGKTVAELQGTTGASVFIIDKEGPPPGCGADERLMAILGSEEQVAHASREVAALLERVAEQDASQEAGEWVRCSAKLGDRKCHQGVKCKNMACGYAHPREWRGFAPAAPPKKPKAASLSFEEMLAGHAAAREASKPKAQPPEGDQGDADVTQPDGDADVASEPEGGS